MYALEWSQSSNGFHIQPLERSITSNREAFTEDRWCRYVVIATGTLPEMEDLAEELRPVLEYRNAER